MQDSSSSLLGLPEEMRLHLFENYIYNPKDNLNLRLVCRQFKKEIDHQVGICTQVAFGSSLVHPEISSFLKTVALKNVHINGSVCPPKILLKFEEIMNQPLKLESLLITGGFWFKFLIQPVLQKCLYIRKLELHCFLFEGALKSSNPSNEDINTENFNIDAYSSIHLPQLTEFSLITEPYPPNNSSQHSLHLYKMHCRTPFLFITSLFAPRLASFELKIKLVSGVELDIVNLLEYSIVSFILRHPLLCSVKLSIEKSKRGSCINLVETASLDHSSLKLTRNQNDEGVLQDLFDQLRNSSSFENLQEFKFQLDAEKGYEQLLSLIEINSVNLNDFGIKIKSRLNFEADLLPTLQSSNENSIKKLFLCCGLKPVRPEVGGGDDAAFRNWIDFEIFTKCPNLEVISFHDDVPKNLLATGRTLLKNVALGVQRLPKLAALILNGLIIEDGDLQDLSTFLKIHATSLTILGITRASLGAAISRYDDNADNYENELVTTGLNFMCFNNLVTNRRLNALLIDMDSVIVNSVAHGLAIENMRKTITGQFRSLMLDLHHDGSFPYWQTSFLGFSVNFPLLF